VRTGARFMRIGAVVMPGIWGCAAPHANRNLATESP